MQDRTNQIIQGTYHGEPYRGIVTRSRVNPEKFSFHTVALLEQLTINGKTRNTIIVDENSDFTIQEIVYPALATKRENDK